MDDIRKSGRRRYDRAEFVSTGLCGTDAQALQINKILYQPSSVYQPLIERYNPAGHLFSINTDTSAKTENPFSGICLDFKVRTVNEPLWIKHRWVRIHVTIANNGPGDIALLETFI